MGVDEIDFQFQNALGPLEILKLHYDKLNWAIEDVLAYSGV